MTTERKSLPPLEILDGPKVGDMLIESIINRNMVNFKLETQDGVSFEVYTKIITHEFNRNRPENFLFGDFLDSLSDPQLPKYFPELSEPKYANCDMAFTAVYDIKKSKGKLFPFLFDKKNNSVDFPINEEAILALPFGISLLIEFQKKIAVRKAVEAAVSGALDREDVVNRSPRQKNLEAIANVKKFVKENSQIPAIQKAFVLWLLSHTDELQKSIVLNFDEEFYLFFSRMHESFAKICKQINVILSDTEYKIGLTNGSMNQYFFIYLCDDEYTSKHFDERKQHFNIDILSEMTTIIIND